MPSNMERAPLDRRLIPKLIDDRAETDPSKVFASIPKSIDLSDGYRDVTYATFARAIDRTAWWLDGAFGRAQAGCRFAYSGPGDLRYQILVAAAMKCRYHILLPSPGNSDERQKQLFRQASCTRIVCAAGILPKMKTSLAGVVEVYILAPELDELIHSDPVLPYPYEVTFDDVEDETCVILHTSGSTGPPKPVEMSIAGVSAPDLHKSLEDPDKELWWRAFSGRRVFTGFPAFHTSGLLTCFLLPIFFDYIVVHGPPTPLTIDAIEAVHKYANVNRGFYPPTILDEIVKCPSAFELMKDIELAVYGGRPLCKETGDKLANVTHLHNVLGQTEILVVPHYLLEPHEWAWFRCHPATGFVLEHHHEDLYRLIAKRLPEYAGVQTIFKVFPHLDHYETGDLFSKHPQKPDLWLYRGRVDDLVVLSTGEKFNPLPFEVMINASPLVEVCIMIGEGRPSPMLLVQRGLEATASMAAPGILDNLGPLIEEANTTLEPQARLAKENIAILPENERLEFSAKGGVMRKSSAKKFASYLDNVTSRSPH